MTRTLALIATSLWLLAGVAGAADGPAGPTTAPTGPRVRVTRAGDHAGTTVGTLTAAGENLTLRLGDGTTAEIPRSSVTRFEVSRGKKGHARWGMLAGAAAGAIVLFASLGEDGKPCDFGACVILPVGGAIAGGLVGLAIRTERWAPAEVGSIRLSVTPVRQGASVSLTLAF